MPTVPRLPTTDIPLHLHPRPVRALCRRLVASAFAADLRRNRYVIAGCVVIVLAAVVVNVAAADVYVSWAGVRPMP